MGDMGHEQVHGDIRDLALAWLGQGNPGEVAGRLDGDRQTAALLLAVGSLIELGRIAFGPERFAAAVAGWVPGEALPLPQPGAPTESEQRERTGTLAALIGAYLRHDGDGFGAVVEDLDQHSARSLVALAVGLLSTMGHVLYGSHERLAAAVAGWEPGGQLPSPEDLDRGEGVS